MKKKECISQKGEKEDGNVVEACKLERDKENKN